VCVLVVLVSEQAVAESKREIIGNESGELNTADKLGDHRVCARILLRRAERIAVQQKQIRYQLDDQTRANSDGDPN
jgi:hypothetical protein